MRKLKAAILAVFLLLPSAASALTQAEINAQTQSILNQLAQLQQQLNQLTAASGQANGVGVVSVVPPLYSCPSFVRTLKLGMSGSDVTELQQFLARSQIIYPEAQVTGYFGVLTQTAVQRWQVKYNIVSSGAPESTGYGVAGPRTYASFGTRCSGSSSTNSTTGDIVGGYIRVTPTSGAAPLPVSVVATVNTVRSCAAATYSLDWGDGAPPQQIFIPAGRCEEVTETHTHTYPNPGTQTIKLSSGAHVSAATVYVSGTAGVQTQIQGQPTSTGATTLVQMSSNSFTPRTLAVARGTTVTWSNTDSMMHNVTADNGSYASGDMPPGRTYSLTLTIAGTYSYYCSIHGGPGGTGMSGIIVVN